METKKELTREELEKVEGGALAPHEKSRPSRENSIQFKRFLSKQKAAESHK